nr:MAG TPA: hypothetical protein [Caudoviricetes sp.]
MIISCQQEIYSCKQLVFKRKTYTLLAGRKDSLITKDI